MTSTQITNVEPGNRIQLPSEWAEALGLHGQVALDKTAAGILVRPLPASASAAQPSSWDDFFASKLSIGSAPPDDDELEVAGDDLLF